jgi:hypothetical protein
MYCSRYPHSSFANASELGRCRTALFRVGRDGVEPAACPWSSGLALPIGRYFLRVERADLAPVLVPVLIERDVEAVGAVRARALAEVPDLTAGNVVLDTMTLPVGVQQEALIEKTIMPARAKIGEPFQVRVVLNSLKAQPAVVTLTRDNRPAAPARRVDLRAGKNVVVFEQNVDRPGFVRYGVSLDTADDEVKENNRGEGSRFPHRQLARTWKAMTAAATAALRLSARPSIGILTSRSHSAS